MSTAGRILRSGLTVGPSRNMGQVAPVQLSLKGTAAFPRCGFTMSLRVEYLTVCMI